MRKGAQQEVLFEFKHALLRDAAYNTLLKSERHPVHLKIAQLLLKDDPNIIDTQPELMAYHLTEGKDSQGAIKAWKSAGRKAVRLSAHVEAIGHFRQALALLDQLPENQSYDRRRLQLLTELGPPLIAVESWSAQSVETLYSECLSLSTKLSDDKQLFSSLRGAWGNASFRGDLDKARYYARQLLELANRTGHASLMIEAELSSAFNHYWAGDYESSLNLVSHVNEQYDPTRHSDNAYIFAVDPGVSALFYTARNLWHLGYPDRSLKKIKQSIELAEKLKHYPSLTWGLGFYASIHYYRREYKQAKKQAKRAIKLCKERNFPIWLAWGQVLTGSAQSMLGDEKGLALMEVGIKSYAARQAGIALPFFYFLQAEACHRHQQIEVGLQSIENAMRVLQKGGIYSSLPDVLRIQAQLMLAAGADNHARVLNLLQQSADLARGQQAQSSVLKTLLVLIEAQTDATKRVALLEQLSALYQQFTEGFDTEDLRQAKKLILQESVE